jgi:hypothetical protein
MLALPFAGRSAWPMFFGRLSLTSNRRTSSESSARRGRSSRRCFDRPPLYDAKNLMTRSESPSRGHSFDQGWFLGIDKIGLSMFGDFKTEPATRIIYFLLRGGPSAAGGRGRARPKARAKCSGSSFSYPTTNSKPYQFVSLPDLSPPTCRAKHRCLPRLRLLCSLPSTSPTGGHGNWPRTGGVSS